ncbi:MAG TPA: excinuclease ABC subunit UvrC, partial [Ktedonobacterales bacterium]|nr:excinuclease ABC subunit UvrC [Ktedonobacterales bacterium]
MADLAEKLQATLNALPHQPGIYLMRDAAGVLLYVGKASSLYHRVRSYFGDPGDLSPKNRALVAKIADIEFIVVGNEIEALILENEYIKRHQPRYNVRLRDDKNYPYIKVSLSEDFPRVYRVRSFRHDGNRYFGPYTNSGAVDATLDLLNKIFPFRTCRYDASAWAPPRGHEDQPPDGWKLKLLPRPCTQYYIHRCHAPCVANTTRAEYDDVIRQVILFLEGKHDEVIVTLRAQMERASEQLEFERATVLRDRVKAVERVLEKQKIISTTGAADQDVIALAGGDDETCAQVFFFRGGRLAGREYFILQGTRDATPGEIMSSFVQQFYDQASHIPAELVLEHAPENDATLRDWLRQRRDGAVTLTVPQRGDKVRLVEMVAQNAREVLDLQRIKWLSDTQKTALALEELRDVLNLPAPPQRIECYDISNIQGSSAVGSMVVFEGGKPRSAEYRRFRIKTVEGANDVASHQEVLRRRFKRLGLAERAAVEDSVDVTGGAVLVAASGTLADPLDDQRLAVAERAGADAGEGGRSGQEESESQEESERQEGVSGGDDAATLADTASSADADALADAAPEVEGDDPLTDEAPLAEADASWARMPDLVIVDGGRPQLNAALAVLNELDVRVPVIGIAKEDHGVIGTHEEIYLPAQPDPLVLARSSQGLYLLQRIRDEAHRFAITYHRQVRTTRTLRSQLDDIAGIGPKRKKA